MPVAVICPSCKAKLKAPDGLIGKTVKCPGCANPVLVKAATGVTPAPASVAAAPRPAARRPRLPEPEVLDEEPAEEALDEVEDEEVEARPRKKRKAGERPAENGDSSDSERSTASFIHFGTLINLLLAPFGYLVPIILWATKRKESAFVDHHGKTWLNFQLSLFVLGLGIMLGVGVGFGLMFVKWWLGLIVFVLVGLVGLALSIYALIMNIVAGMKAKNGEWFEYRCLFRLFK